MIPPQKNPFNEEQIQKYMKKFHIPRNEVEDMIEQAEHKYSKDFTDDGKRMNSALLQELVELFEAWGQDDDPAVNQRVERMFHEIKAYILKELNKKGKKSDFTDDAKDAFYKQLYAAMTQLNRLLDSPKLWESLDALTESERTALYNHPLAKTNSQLLP